MILPLWDRNLQIQKATANTAAQRLVMSMIGNGADRKHGVSGESETPCWFPVYRVNPLSGSLQICIVPVS